MDSTPSTTTPSQTNTTSFPTANKPSAPNATASSRQQPDLKVAQAAAPETDSLLKRMTQRAHDAVDSVSERIGSTVGGVQGGVAKAGETRDEWVESAREAIRQHPFAAIGTAVLIGLALRSLTSSRDR